MPTRRPGHRHRVLVVTLLLGGLSLSATACGADDPTEQSTEPEASVPAGTTGAPSTSTPGPTSEPTGQPPLPADPTGYTPEYAQATLTALYHEYQAALVAYQTTGEVDATVQAGLANVYHPDVYEQQIRNLEDYFPGGANLEDPPGAVQVEVTDIHSVSADCILAITTYDIGAVTTLDAPAEEGFLVGLARNPNDPDGTRPWLITVEYSTADGEPLPEDACA